MEVFDSCTAEPSLKDFEHNLTSMQDFQHDLISMGDECNCLLVRTFFSTSVLGNWDED